MKIMANRFLAASLHLAASFLIFLLAAALVFGVWYPYPYSELSGGADLFRLLMVVDVLLGPLLTLVIFNVNKPTAELRRDLTFVVLMQFVALGYGLWTVAVARPVYLVFEIDRFRVVHAVDIPEELIPKAPPSLRSLPIFGKGILSVRQFSTGQEGFDATLAALQGLELAVRPDLWQPYLDATAQIRGVGMPLVYLKTRFPESASLIDGEVKKIGVPINELISVPVVSRQHFWTVLLDVKTLEIQGFIPLDSF